MHLAWTSTKVRRNLAEQAFWKSRFGGDSAQRAIFTNQHIEQVQRTPGRWNGSSSYHGVLDDPIPEAGKRRERDLSDRQASKPEWARAVEVEEA